MTDRNHSSSNMPSKIGLIMKKLLFSENRRKYKTKNLRRLMTLLMKETLTSFWKGIYGKKLEEKD